MPNTVGGISIATNQLANTALLNLNRISSTLGKLVSQLSSGLRVVTAADDPSGLAIAVNLNDQATGFDTANLNVQDATNAANVADGALSTVTSILQRVRSLAIEAANTITSSTDRQALQAKSAVAPRNQPDFEQHELQRSSTARRQPRGLPAGDSTPRRRSPRTRKSVRSTRTSPVAARRPSSPASRSARRTPRSSTARSKSKLRRSTRPRKVSIVSFFTSGTSSYSQLAQIFTLSSNTGVFASAFSFDGVTVNFNPSAGTVDVNSTAFIKVLQYVSVNSNPNGPAFQFQGGANEGATISVGLVSVSTSSLRVSNINVATTQIVNGNPSTAGAVLGAQDAIGQIDQAITQVNGARAVLGAVISRLQNAVEQQQHRLGQPDSVGVRHHGPQRRSSDLRVQQTADPRPDRHDGARAVEHQRPDGPRSVPLIPVIQRSQLARGSASAGPFLSSI